MPAVTQARKWARVVTSTRGAGTASRAPRCPGKERALIATEHPDPVSVGHPFRDEHVLDGTVVTRLQGPSAQTGARL